MSCTSTVRSRGTAPKPSPARNTNALALSNTTVVLVAYGTDLDTLMPQLVQAVQAVPRVLSHPSPGIQLSAFATDGLELTLLFWICDPENGQGSAKSEVNLALLAAIRAAGVEIPYPQRVLRGTLAAPLPPGSA